MGIPPNPRHYSLPEQEGSTVYLDFHIETANWETQQSLIEFIAINRDTGNSLSTNRNNRSVRQKVHEISINLKLQIPKRPNSS